MQKGHAKCRYDPRLPRSSEQVAAEQKRKLAPLTDDLKLLDSGLDSLSFRAHRHASLKRP